MADPLSITASMLAVITAAVHSTQSLHGTIKRFRDRDKTLRRLQNELEDLMNILSSLGQVTDADLSMMALLKSPIERCSQICREFEDAMEGFSGKSTTGFRDWAKMEFMRGDINEFIDIIAGYKSTISVGLGTITIHSSKVSQRVLQEYNEMIQDTTYSLEVHLQRIDEKLARFTIQDLNTSKAGTNLEDEREVTKQCLRICEDARAFIESLTQRGPAILRDTSQSAAPGDTQDYFEAQLLTRQALDKNRASFVDIINRLQERLGSLVSNGDQKGKERLALQEDIQISRQCLEVCNMASEVSRQKVYRIGEVVADGDSDQLVGSMTEEALRNLTDRRYSSRFGAVVTNATNSAEVATTSSPSAFESQNLAFPLSRSEEEQFELPKIRREKPSSNEMKKRAMAGTPKNEDK
ncbi:hypothetical protein BDV59DRAFT_148234 [Aspergillus ambiguus]|uniref:uncharacterized protein n=1 Tax=Aspergillus ambiguus TaxID=176160 RepID=UPI003CCD825B